MPDILSDLVQDWHAAGIECGDTVLVHSSLRRTCARGVTPEQVMQSFLDAVGPQGTVLFPLFNFDFCKGVAFDMRTTPSHMGAMTEAARLHPEAVRTGHPIYSFAAIGAKASEFSGICNKSGYGSDSPFARLITMNGKIAVLDLPGQNSMTIYHHVEETLQVDYRFHKTFTAKYTDASGQTSDRDFEIFVRDIDRGVLTHVNPMDQQLWERGLLSGCQPKEGHGLRVVRARDVFNAAAAVIKAGQAENMLFRFDTDKQAK